jgi:murein DD-endopeptidase MepM/ murein hydrolase activator NlpD
MRVAVVSLLLAVFLGWGPCFALGETWRVAGIPSVVRQGDVFRIRLTADGVGAPWGDFQGKEISFYPEGQGKGYAALVGVDLESPAGIYPLSVTPSEGGRGSRWRFEVKVIEAFFGVQRITLPPEMVDLDPQSLKRAKGEARKIHALWATRSENRWWDGDFVFPVEGAISSDFGVRRILNGQRRSRHNGIDIRASRGKKVVCPNGGRVAMVDEFFFGGNTAVIDHGEGLYSFFMHLDRVAVRMNQAVHKGDVLGTVGATGRATGPHLHWGVSLNGARVDPLSLMEAINGDRKAIQMVRKRRYMAEKWKKRPKNGENLGKGGEILD